jgi:hypothetical protein
LPWQLQTLVSRYLSLEIWLVQCKRSLCLERFSLRWLLLRIAVRVGMRSVTLLAAAEVVVVSDHALDLFKLLPVQQCFVSAVPCSSTAYCGGCCE